MKLFFSIVLILFLGTLAKGSETFDEANRLYESGQFEEAVSLYEELLNDEGPRVSVLNNLGSAYFRLEDFGRSILAFERALVLDPGDLSLRSKLKLAQDQVAVFSTPEPKSWWGFFANVSPDRQAMFVILAAILWPVCAFLMVRYGKRARWAMVVFVLSGVLVKMVLGPLKHKEASGPRGIILADPATVRLSPFEKADSRGTLSTGREVHLGRVENHFYWVEGTSGSLQGWVHEEEVAPVIPKSLPANQG